MSVVDRGDQKCAVGHSVTHFIHAHPLVCVLSGLIGRLLLPFLSHSWRLGLDGVISSESPTPKPMSNQRASVKGHHVTIAVMTT